MIIEILSIIVPRSVLYFSILKFCFHKKIDRYASGHSCASEFGDVPKRKVLPTDFRSSLGLYASFTMDIVSRKQVYSICGNFKSLSPCELFLVTYCLAKFACVRQELIVDHAVPPSFGTPRE
jgi:hypothetical protein